MMGYYDEISFGYDELHMQEQLNKLGIIKQNLRLGKKSKMLDVGCGSGISSDFDCFVVGIDPSFGLLKINRSSNRVNGFSEHLPFKDDSFDFVISITAAQNFDDIGLAFSEICRVGRKHFAISVLKKSKSLAKIKKAINGRFKIEKVEEEEKDIIFFLSKT